MEADRPARREAVEQLMERDLRIRLFAKSIFLTEHSLTLVTFRMFLAVAKKPMATPLTSVAVAHHVVRNTHAFATTLQVPLANAPLKAILHADSMIDAVAVMQAIALMHAVSIIHAMALIHTAPMSANAKNNAVETFTQNSATAVLQQPERVFVVLALLNNLVDEMNVIMVVNRSYCKPTQHRMQPCRLAILLMLEGEAEHDNHLSK